MDAVGSSSVWHGLGASPGLAVGTACVIRTEADLSAVGEQDILVARHATPSLFPSLIKARAAVCETGGLLCHLAVLAREVGKPCVTGLNGIVDTLKSGTLMRADGTTGIVECTFPNAPAPDLQVPASVPGPEPTHEAKVPVLQFGLFSTAFECVEAHFDLETAIRTAALVSTPEAFALGPVWAFTITGNRVFIAAEPLQAALDTLVDRLEAGMLSAGAVRARYQDLISSDIWSALAQSPTSFCLLPQALRDYVALNQITWAASVAKEPYTKRYKNFLFERLAELGEGTRERLFLDSLIMPDHSYILRSCMEEGIGVTSWSGALPRNCQADTDRHRAALAHTLPGAASRRQSSALEQLKERLDHGDAEKVRLYVATITDLVDITERKNTDLYRCSLALFGNDACREAIIRLLRADTAERADGRSEYRLVKTILRKLQGQTPIGLERAASYDQS